MKKTRRSTWLISSVLAILLIAGIFTMMPHMQAADEVARGTWGTCEWTLDSDGLLTIGAGEGADIGGSVESVPWFANNKDIKSVSITGKVVLPAASHSLFYKCFNLTDITGLENLDTSNVKNMFGMFQGCSSLQSLDLSSFDTRKTTSMISVFQDCSALTSLNISSFDTSNVTSFGSMFRGCSSLKALDLRNFNTSKCTTMNYMFYDCLALEQLDVSSFNTENVIDARTMFYNCASLKKLDVSGFKLKDRVVNEKGETIYFWGMFAGCSSLTELDLSGFKTSANSQNVDMLDGTYNLAKLTVSEDFSFNGFHTSTPANCYPMTPTDDYFPGTTGKWKNLDTGDTYLADEIPSNTAATYVIDYAVSGSIPVTKTITGGTPEANETFTFNIAANEQTPNAPLPESTTCTVTGAGDTAFGNITYSKTGKYYYDITEVAGTNTEYTYDSSKYIVCVEVTNKTGGGYNANLVAIWKNNIVNEESAKQDKIEFVNTYAAPPGSLTLSKNVTGELADLNASFTFDVTFSDTTYSFDAGRYGKIENGKGTITLKNGESVTFTGITNNTTYTIKETNGDTYTTSIDNNGTTVEGKDASGIVGKKAVVSVAYTNDLPYSPVVGLNMNSMYFALLAILSIAGLGFILIRKYKAGMKR